jgi:hypothetical protein
MRCLVRFCLFIIMALAPLVSASAQTPAAGNGREVLTNQSIINLAKARFKERTIISLIRSSPTAFDLSTVKLIELKKSGVSERIVLEMIERQAYVSTAQGLASLRDDEFFKADDEAFFNSAPLRIEPRDKRTNKQGDKPDDKQAKENESSVFGSRSGSKSKTTTRGLGGAGGDRSNESELSGTATVRIVRPPGESSGEPKLERAAKLDNRAVLEMVQAGFSEGTILRKIETTQVEFDVSSKGLAELRQNRVSERIIKAMTEAMDEGKKQ